MSQRQGIETALLAETETIARAAQEDRLTLMIGSFIAGTYALYQHAGFLLRGEVERGDSVSTPSWTPRADADTIVCMRNGAAGWRLTDHLRNKRKEFGLGSRSVFGILSMLDVSSWSQVARRIRENVTAVVATLKAVVRSVATISRRPPLSRARDPE
ncbi:MAG TPA: hypothetical protein PKA55_02265 [Rhodoblastus sp.]|nr:hypothetical protein [Rhodoblastus sp.]